MYIIPWRLRNSVEIFTVFLKNYEFKGCTCSLCSKVQGAVAESGIVLLGVV